MSGLKPCLLCEGEAKLLRRSGRAGIACPSKWYRERVECKVCGLNTREYKRPGSAFRSWNKRPRPTPAPCDELETAGWLWEYAQYRTDDRGYYGYETVITESNPTDHVSPAEKLRNVRELVTRQNAEEVIENLKNEAAEKDKLIQSLIDFDSEEVKRLEADNKRLREALEVMLVPYEGSDCRRDHHGYCQEHFLEEDCCVAKARAAIEEEKL